MPSTETKTGYIYILHNPSLRDETLKIGITTRTPYIRAAELSRKTGVAQEYVVAYLRWVMHPEAAEAKIHTYLDRYRINDKREFFQLPLEDQYAPSAVLPMKKRKLRNGQDAVT